MTYPEDEEEAFKDFLSFISEMKEKSAMDIDPYIQQRISKEVQEYFSRLNNNPAHNDKEETFSETDHEHPKDFI